MSVPLMSEIEIKRRFFGLKTERPRAEPGSVLVLVGGSAPIVLWPGNQPTPGEGVYGGYTSAYMVDLSSRPIVIKDATVTARDGLKFLLSLSATYRVNDPIRIVNEKITDGEMLLRNVLIASTRRAARLFDVEQALEAEEAVRKILETKSYTEKVPFDVAGVDLDLKPDPIAEKHIIDKRNQQYVIELQGIKAKADQDAQDIRAKADEEAKQRRRTLYESILRQGAIGLLGEQMANDPSQVGEVARIVMEQDAKQRDLTLSMLKTFNDIDGITDEKQREFVQILLSNVQNQLGGYTLSATRAALGTTPPDA